MMVNDGRLVTRNNPVEYEDGKPILNPSAMVPDIPYPFSAYGIVVWAIKRMDDSIEFYYLNQ